MRVFKIAIALILLILLSTQRDIIEQNVCSLCSLQLTEMQSGECGTDSEVPQVCGFCRKDTNTVSKPADSSKIELSPVTVHAHQMELEDRFLYRMQSLSSDHILLYNPELGYEFPIFFNKLSSAVPRDSSPDGLFVNSAIDKELIPLESIARIWSYGSVVASVPVSSNSNYHLEIYGQHDSPQPVVINVHINSQALGLLKWELGDESWSSQCLYVPKQFVEFDSTVDIELFFVNDGGLNGNRDAGIAWIRMVPVQLPE